MLIIEWWFLILAIKKKFHDNISLIGYFQIFYYCIVIFLKQISILSFKFSLILICINIQSLAITLTVLCLLIKSICRYNSVIHDKWNFAFSRRGFIKFNSYLIVNPLKWLNFHSRLILFNLLEPGIKNINYFFFFLEKT